MTEGQTIARQLAESVNNSAPHAPSQATPAGCGEASAIAGTLDALWKQWGVASLTLAEVREHYFPHIETDKHLRSLIRKGAIELRTFTLTKSRLECPRVTLADLAEFLNSKAQRAAQRPIERIA